MDILQKKSDELARVIMETIKSWRGSDEELHTMISSQVFVVLTSTLQNHGSVEVKSEESSLNTRLLKSIAVSSNVVQLAVAKKLLQVEEYESILASVVEMIPNE